ncbi:hypothetical protein CVT24_006643 [Panaeolus cyanescens]|uniref:Uncharacterized protein n=1 Tax=Panaeolus cyanescens TaxID=181874 RepID=A0A409YS98_9AGAR|nr:hypothetical protein CVT24_006643 [Panaeolus cyanescens]
MLKTSKFFISLTIHILAVNFRLLCVWLTFSVRNKIGFKKQNRLQATLVRASPSPPPPTWTPSEFDSHLNMSTSSSFLLAKRNPNAALTPYDGKVGAVIGNYVYTTPNETFIPLPVLGEREVHVRKDYRYGPDDHTLWPQPYSSLAPHLAAIPRKPSDPNHPLAPLWLDPQPSDFLPTSQGTISTGLGRIDPDFLAKIEALAGLLTQRFNAYVQSLSKDKQPNLVVSSLHRIAGYVRQRLASLPTTWHQIRFTVTEVQRLLLELHGCLDYIEIYKPQIDGTRPSPSTPSTLPTIGAFTSNVRVVEEFSAIGIPVWLIRAKEGQAFGSNVLAEVKPTNYKDTLVLDKHPGFPTVFKGSCSSDSFEVVTHVLQFSRHWLKAPSPFSGPDPAPAPSSSTSPLASTSSGQVSSRGPDGRPPAKKAKVSHNMAMASANAGAGRDKFQSLRGPFAPFSIPAWAEQLRNVDRTVPSAVEGVENGGFYAYPDPGLFISVQKDDRRQQMIERFCRLFDVWSSRSREVDGMALSNQQWRDLLCIDFRLAPEKWVVGNNKSANRQRAVLEKLIPKGCSARAIGEGEGYKLTVTGETFASGSLPPHDAVRKLLFFLYMLNFQAELIALDRVARLDFDEGRALEQEGEISLLFPYDTFIVPISNPNAGLAVHSLRDRIPYLRTFARIMSGWKGDKPQVFYLGKHQSGADSSIPLELAALLENEVAKFYCQQFFNYFRRAAQIPHFLSPPASTS